MIHKKHCFFYNEEAGLNMKAKKNGVDTKMILNVYKHGIVEKSGSLLSFYNTQLCIPC